MISCQVLGWDILMLEKIFFSLTKIFFQYVKIIILPIFCIQSSICIGYCEAFHTIGSFILRLCNVTLSSLQQMGISNFDAHVVVGIKET